MALIGIVIPKRHARRAVTRNAIRRQVRAAVGQIEARLPPGVWLVRLRARPDVQLPGTQLPGSAVSAMLKVAVRAELGRLFAPVLVAPAGEATAGRLGP